MTNRAIGRRTGLNEETVAHALRKLEAIGLYKDGFAVLPDDKKDWFRTGDGGGFAGYRNYVRSPTSELTVIQHSVFSYLLHCKEQKFRPKTGWTPAYIAKALRCSTETVKKSLERLNEFGLLHWDGSTISFYKTLYPDHLMLFLSKDEEASSIAFGEDLDAPPVSAITRLREKALEVHDPLEERIVRRLKDNLSCDDDEVREFLPDLLYYMRVRDIMPRCDPELDDTIRRWMNEDDDKAKADKCISSAVGAQPIAQ
jgi:DNA-binding Lrp family transcriptional regulator